MLSDEQVIERLRVALEQETAAIDPPSHLNDSIRRELARTPTAHGRRHRRWTPTIGGLFATLSTAVAVGVAVLAIAALGHHGAGPAAHPANPAHVTGGHPARPPATTPKAQPSPSKTPYIETHPIGVLWLIIWVGALAVTLGSVRRGRQGASPADRGSGWVMTACLIVGVALLLPSPWIFPAAMIRPPAVAVVAGMVLFVAGFALRLWSIHTLGEFFTMSVMTSADQPVITTGPYRAVRHPAYAGALVSLIGAGAVWGNWAGLVALLIPVLLGLLYRIRVEENALMGAPGDAYLDYAVRHKRLIPLVW